MANGTKSTMASARAFTTAETDSVTTEFALPEPGQGPSGRPARGLEPVTGRAVRRAGCGLDESGRHRHGR